MRPIVLLILSLPALTLADKGLRFDSPEVVDLAAQAKPSHGATLTALTPADAEAIRKAAAITEGAPALRASDEEYGCKAGARACAVEHERKLLGSGAKREGKQIVIGSARFVDWKQPASKSADGDAGTHYYLGRLPGSGYHRVEVQFEHDAPGSFLVHPQNGHAAFVHNGSDTVVVSPDGARVISFRGEGLTLTVAALDVAGPKLELTCQAASGRDAPAASFKGWHDATSFDLLLARGTATVPVRVMKGKDGWQVAAAGKPNAYGFDCGPR